MESTTDNDRELFLRTLLVGDSVIYRPVMGKETIEKIIRIDGAGFFFRSGRNVDPSGYYRNYQRFGEGNNAIMIPLQSGE